MKSYLYVLFCLFMIIILYPFYLVERYIMGVELPAETEEQAGDQY